MFVLNRKSDSYLYEQLYEQLKQQILSGNMKAGQRLPATRELAAEYQISRNTVINAYYQLEIEGYIKPVTGSGYYVEHLPLTKVSIPKPTFFPYDSESTDMTYDYIFSYGDLDYNCYNSKAWRKCMLDAYDTLSLKDNAAYEESQGISNLRRILSSYLYLSRGVKCSAEQIIIISGHQQSLNIIANLFSYTDWNFAMEDPGYNGTRHTMKQNHFHITPIPVENDGISIKELQNLFQTLLYVTPSHQFPMGSVLSITKRLQLLEWAEKNNGYIIEDDYDSELRYHNRPIPSLQSIDSGNRTIYLGTFSKSLSPDLRIAYIVLPMPLWASYREKYLYANCTVPTLLQLTLTKYMESGEYQRHLNAMRTHYRKKHDYIRKYVADYLSDKAALLGEDSGLHFVLSIQTRSNQTELIDVFARNKIQIYPTEPFWINKALCPSNQLLLGFSAIPMKQVPDAMGCLSEVIHTQLK